MTRRVAFVGTCPSSKMLAPYGDLSWEIWACGPDNAGDGVLPRVTRWFELHGDLGFPGGETWEKSYVDWLNRQPFTLIANRTDLFPAAASFPKDALVSRFGNEFFTSTPAWMLAYAIMTGVTEIGLYGLDMSSRHEYLIQRPGMKHWMWLAEREHGIEIHAPLESDILQPSPLYGYDLNTPHGRKLEIRRKELVGRIGEEKRKEEQAHHDRVYLEGALDDIDYQQSVWTGERNPALNLPSRLEDDRKVVNLKGD